MLNITDIMSRNVVGIEHDATRDAAAKLMHWERVGSLIVIQNGLPVGILTERDIVGSLAKGADPNTLVSQIMSSPIHSFRLDGDVMQVANAMRNNNIKKVPIIEGDKVLGMVTQTDIIKHIFRSLNTLCSAYNDGSLSCKEFAEKSRVLFQDFYPDESLDGREWYMRCKDCSYTFMNPEQDGMLTIATCPRCNSEQIDYAQTTPEP